MTCRSFLANKKFFPLRVGGGQALSGKFHYFLLFLKPSLSEYGEFGEISDYFSICTLAGAGQGVFYNFFE